MVAAILERRGTRLVHNRAGANMAGGVASALAAAARRGGAPRRRPRAVRGRRVLARRRCAAELRPRAVLLANLFRDQLDRYGELETIADRWAEVVAGLPAAHARSCSTPTTRSSPTSGATARRIYFGVDDDALALPGAAARVGLQALPPLRAPPTSTRPSTSATSAATAARTAARAGPTPRCGATDVELRGIRSRRVHARTRADGRPRASSCRCPASTTSTTRSAPRRCACALGRAARRRRRRPGRGRARVRPRRDDRARRPARRRSCCVKNPAGANEVLRTLALEGTRARRPRRAQRPHRRRPRRLVGVGRRLGADRPARARG